MSKCENCGCNVYALGCVNCDEPNYIDEQEADEFAAERTTYEPATVPRFADIVPPDPTGGWAMTPATLRRMEWAGAPITGLDNIPIRTCPDCCVSERRGHAPDCALDAAIREAEQGEPMPDLQVGDEVSMAQTVTFRREDAAAGWRPARPLSVKRNGVVIWRKEAPTL